MNHDSTGDAKTVVILEEDRKAARDYVRVHGSDELKQNDALRQVREKLLAFVHAQRGVEEFQLVQGLRPARCDYEQGLFDSFNDRISAEALKKPYEIADEQPVDGTIIRAYYEDLEWSLNHLREFTTWIWEQQPSNEHRPQTAKSPEYSLREMMRPSLLSKRKVVQVRQFVADARVAKSLGRVRHGDSVASTAVDLALLIISNVAAHWATCQEIAENSQTDPRYLYATTAEELFFDHCKNLRLVEVESLLKEEEAVCRWYLQQQNKPSTSPLVQNNFHVDGTGHTLSPQINVSTTGDSKVSAEPVDDNEQPSPSVEKKERTPRPDAKPSFANWALGLDEKQHWQLFHQRKGRWEQSMKVAIPKGNADAILRVLADKGGAASRQEMHARLKLDYVGKNPKQLTRVCTEGLKKAKQAIRAAIAECGRFDYEQVPNPIPFEDSIWRAAIGIGYVVVNDDGRPDFRTREQMAIVDWLDGS